jgi:hypothetical protein
MRGAAGARGWTPATSIDLHYAVGRTAVPAGQKAHDALDKSPAEPLMGALRLILNATRTGMGAR